MRPEPLRRSLGLWFPAWALPAEVNTPPRRNRSAALRMTEDINVLKVLSPVVDRPLSVDRGETFDFCFKGTNRHEFHAWFFMVVFLLVSRWQVTP